MALFHLSAQPISRAAGRSATAAAAYRAGVEITDERTGNVHDYSRKIGVLDSEIILPGGGTADRAEFWNGIEKHHKRGDAVLSREVEVSLPTELTKEERRALAVGFARELADRYGVAADVALHAPRTVTDKDLEKEPGQYYEIDPATGRRHNGNWHAHIMLSACYVSPTGDLGKKAVELDPIHCQRAKIENMVDRERVRWAHLANSALERAGHAERIDHRTLEAQGIERKPSIHLGPAASGIERRGEVSQKTEHHQERQAKAASEVAALIANSQARASAAIKAAEQETINAFEQIQIQINVLAAEQAQAAAIKEAEKQAAHQAQREAVELTKQQAIDDKLTAAKEKEDDRIRDETLAALGKSSRATDENLIAASGDLGRAVEGAERRVAERHYGRVVEAARRQLERVGGVVQNVAQRIEYVVGAVAAAAQQIAKEAAAKLELVRQRIAREVWAAHPENPLNIAKREAQEAAAKLDMARIQKEKAASDLPASWDMKHLMTDRERELAIRFAIASNAQDGKGMMACGDDLVSVKREAMRALAAVQPQEVNVNAIEHQAKLDQNKFEQSRGNPEPWYIGNRVEAVRGTCSWDVKAEALKTKREEHLKTERPKGFFKKAEGQEWDARTQKLANEAEAWTKGADIVRRNLAKTVAEQLDAETQTNASRNRQNAPEHVKQLARYEFLTEFEKQLGMAVEPFRARERQIEKDDDYDLDR